MVIPDCFLGKLKSVNGAAGKKVCFLHHDTSISALSGTTPKCKTAYDNYII